MNAKPTDRQIDRYILVAERVLARYKSKLDMIWRSKLPSRVKVARMNSLKNKIIATNARIKSFRERCYGQDA